MSRSSVALLCALLAMSPLSALAQTPAFLNGTVYDETGHPVSGASVKVAGQNLNLSTQTDPAGHFAFPTLGAGRYTVSVTKGDEKISEPIDLTSAGQNVSFALTPLKEIAHATVSTHPLAKRGGTDVAIDSTQLAHLPTGQYMPSILAQLPSAAMGSNGQVHINGDHNGINYYIDGVQMPASLNRAIGNEIDPTNIGYLDTLEGAYPAQYGDKFAAVLNVGTRSYSGPAGYQLSAQGGSFATSGGTFSYHASEGRGSLSVSTAFSRNDRGIDPPVAGALHDDTSDASQFLRYSLPVHGADILNFDVMHTLQTFQVPIDSAHGVPSATDDNEFQNDTFVTLQYRHSIGDHGALSFGPSFRRSNLLDTNDPANDLAGADGSSCTDFSNCGYYSVFANRTSHDFRWTTDYALRSTRHEVRAGGIYDASVIDKDYLITLQPNNGLLNPSGGTFTATDTSPNIAHQQEAYVQDSWSMGSLYTLDYGLRMDGFQIGSTDFHDGFSQFSPRVKLTRVLGAKASVYAYYGRLFEPFSFENVSPATAESLYVAGSNPGAAFDLKPQRDSLYELGGHLAVGSSDVGVRISHKVSTDYLDDTQVGATNLHQDINFPQGRVDIQTAYVQHPLPRDGRVYFSLTHGMAQNSQNCETQLLQNCAAGGAPGGMFVASDHDQRWDANGGVLLNDLHGGWFSFNGEYGSGLSTNPANCGGDVINCKVPPHLVFNAEKGFSLSPRATMSVSIDNLLNDRYALTVDNALQGTHFARPRSVNVELTLKSDSH